MKFTRALTILLISSTLLLSGCQALIRGMNPAYGLYENLRKDPAAQAKSRRLSEEAIVSYKIKLDATTDPLEIARLRVRIAEVEYDIASNEKEWAKYRNRN